MLDKYCTIICRGNVNMVQDVVSMRRGVQCLTVVFSDLIICFTNIMFCFHLSVETLPKYIRRVVDYVLMHLMSYEFISVECKYHSTENSI